ncbi:hypothetical protein [Paenibacillus odorifer]|uniref:hypothetical protein n=1 Tax=Paenibacillus odorifer TaxID=189426 RepID=UPI00096EA098|nr:hypothetical protein [Paenibacillus odorifer]OME23403.1 hypothetical protein BSK57_16455 [Paenibacillus odorifer]
MNYKEEILNLLLENDWLSFAQIETAIKPKIPLYLESGFRETLIQLVEDGYVIKRPEASSYSYSAADLSL